MASTPQEPEGHQGFWGQCSCPPGQWGDGEVVVRGSLGVQIWWGSMPVILCIPSLVVVGGGLDVIAGVPGSCLELLWVLQTEGPEGRISECQ